MRTIILSAANGAKDLLFVRGEPLSVRLRLLTKSSHIAGTFVMLGPGFVVELR